MRRRRPGATTGHQRGTLLAAAVLAALPGIPGAPGRAAAQATGEFHGQAAENDSLGYLNLDFESPDYPRDWYTGSEGYAVELDSTTAAHGRQSLRIRYLKPGRIGVATQTIPGRAVAGRRLSISASVRSESITRGWAGLWCRVDGIDRLFAFATTRDRAARGTTPWSRQEVTVPVDSGAVEVHFGAQLTGDGVAWFDHFELALDGVPVEEPPEPPRFDPGPAVLDWIRAHAAPLTTDDPGQECGDLVPLLRAIGNARLVGLGEGTHGTREFLRMKHRVFRCLVEELGFRILAMESGLPETERLNHYVMTGEGDPRAILRSMRFWTWETEELLDLLRWMRSVNEAGRGPVQLLGFDMQSPAAAAEPLLRFLRRAASDSSSAEAPYAAEIESLRVVALAGDAEARGPHALAAGMARGDRLAGTRVRLRGWIRTEAIEWGEAALWIRADADSSRFTFEGMEGAGPRGSTAWAPYSVELAVPANARRVSFGALLRGDGTAWFDSLALDVDGRPVLARSTYDFGFEDARPYGGLRVSGPGYTVDADTAAARFGRRSLRLRQDPVAVTGVRLARWTRAAGAARSIVARLLSDSLQLTARDPEPVVARAVRNARLVLQACEARLNPPTRDRAMAENVAWLRSRAPAGTGIALWAHNAHVSRRPGSMGAYLAERFGREYVPLALAFHEGSYLAADGRAVRPYEAMPSHPGSLEWALHRTAIPRLSLDLRQASPSDPASSALTGSIPFRSIGALPVAHGFYPTRLARDFDAVIFFDRTGPSRPLERERRP